MAESFLLVEAFLCGGAPWGFTLQGGLEHGEPLIISKVEDGGKADSLQCPLLAGDEVIIINGIELSGFRQEAISLVKGSYKTLQLTIRRNCCTGLRFSESVTSSCQRAHDDQCSGGVQIRIRNRHSEPGSRPHSWHSTKLGEDSLGSNSMMQISQGAVGARWHQNYHASASTTDLSGYDGGFLRTSPDQYSSRGSMESIDHPHPGYSSCNQLSVSKSSNSIDHLHSKRDSAYSSFSTSSSIPEYLTAAPSFSKERSYSMDSVPQHRTAEGMHQADIRYVQTVYDSQQGVSKEQEVPSAVPLMSGENKAPFKSGSIPGRVGHHSINSNSTGTGSGPVTIHRHSVGPVWGQPHNHNSYENLKGAPSPPVRSDSFAAIRNHERPNSWSSLEQARSFRALHKGSWHNSSGSVASGKSSFAIEGQLHTVIEKSPESSPTIKPKQSLPASSQPGSVMLPTGIYAVPLPEAHFAQMPTTNPSSSVYPALAKESESIPQRDHCVGLDSGVRQTVENGYQSTAAYSAQPHIASPVQDDHQAKSYLYRSHFQTDGCNHPGQSIGQERKDPYTPVHPRREKPKYTHITDQMETSRQPREKESTRYNDQIAQYQGSTQSINPSSRCHSDSSTYQLKDQDLDHPLTRLENALAKVQRCTDPPSTASHQREHTMSVMEKVSHFERNQSKPSSYGYSSSQTTRTTGKTSSHGRSWSHSYDEHTEAPQDVHLSYQPQHRKSNDLHRSKSFFQLSEENGRDIHRSKSTIQLGEENSNDVQVKEDLKDIFGIRDTTFNQAYRNSIKDAQSKVLRSTSFRRRDLSSNPPAVPEKHMILERKGPKTGPKPTSPHTPKERHVVPVEVSAGSISPELPKAPSVVRICGRKRFTMEQKKRSYSEPENMHEVGVSDQESGLFQGKASQQFPETSVADRRRMFELVASRNAGPKLSTSRPELKQMQQDALADYVERKTGRRMDGRQHRPRSAYMHATTSSKDSQSLTSTLSLCSLQEPVREDVSGVNLTSSVLTANSQRPWHPSRGTHTRTQSEKYHSSYRQQDQTAKPQKPKRMSERHVPERVPDSASDQSSASSSSVFGQRMDGDFKRAGPARNSGKSASAEDLLDHTEERPVSQHFRSRSSPVVDNKNQDFLAGDLKSSRTVFTENRALGSVAAAQRSSGQVCVEQNLSPNQSNPPVIRRDRQRHSDRPRAHSASGLAASVGLPCPLSPQQWPGASETQCQPNLDTITFPGTVQASESDQQHSDNANGPKDAVQDFNPSPLPIEVTGSHATRSTSSPTKALPSLRVSESSVHFPLSPGASLEDDEVFLVLPSSPSIPSITEANFTKDPPVPDSPVQLQAKEESQRLNRVYEASAKTTHKAEQLIHLSLPENSDPDSTHDTEGVFSGVEWEEASKSLDLGSSLLARRERTEAEIRVELLAQDLVSRDEALVPLLEVWSSTGTLDLMEDIFPSHASPPWDQRKSTSHISNSDHVVEGAVKPVHGRIETDLDKEERDINQKKAELVQVLATCVEALRLEKASLAEEQQRYSAFGCRMDELVEQHCKPNENEKYRMFIGDMEKIVNLLLSLSGRLARVENALHTLGEKPEGGSAEERASLQQKRRQLRSQQEDARELKENLDRREQIVLHFLGSYLSPAQLQNYHRYIRAKPTLLIRQRHLDELIRHGEEQQHRLSENLYMPSASSLPPSTNSSGSNSPRPTTVTSL
ncbi:protein Shroom3 [Trichomycterus rosablanca]|uniref:protein Shroom3 n=1 Tax=Trichomycterus rosablanca TaxID=2290929 RepID=UPI002F35418E